MSVDRVWAEYTTGRPDVIYSYMEGGPNWQNTNAKDFVNRTYLNPGELPLPRDASGLTKLDLIANGRPFVHADPHDLNDDGRFSVADYASDARAKDRNSNAYLDPQDLIVTFSDKVDGDGNGYIDDISGWDFLRDDNDPQADNVYDHADNWIAAAVAEANNRIGRAPVSVGVCPDCTVLPVRVSQAVVPDSDKFSRAIAFAVDAGAAVISISAGTLNATPSTQEAIDYAWDRGTVMVAGSHDLGTYHHLFPNTGYDRFLVANTLVPDQPEDAAHLRTNFREYSQIGAFGIGSVLVALPNTGSYSHTSPIFGGLMGLLISHARNLVEAGQLARVPSASELRQLIIDGTSPVTDADHTRADSFQASAGRWSQYYGYGRPNAFRIAENLSAGRIPPEADLASPRLFGILDPVATPSVAIEGDVAAPRGTSYRYTLDVAPGLEPVEAEFAELKVSEWASEPRRGVLGEWDIASIPRSAWERQASPPQEGWVGLTEFTWTIRLRVTDDQGRVAEVRRSVAVHHDPTTIPGFPRELPGGGTAPRLVDLDRDGTREIVVADNAGAVHAFRLGGGELPGFPVVTEPARVLTPGQEPNYLAASAYASGALRPYPESITGAVAVGDLRGNGRLGIVAATVGDGKVYAWDDTGSLLEGFPVATDPTLSVYPASPLRVPEHNRNRVTTGILGAPALGDIDGDGRLDIVVGAMDGHVYVWNTDGARLPGFPAIADEPGGCLGNDHRIASSPAVGDVDADGALEIVVTSQCNRLHVFEGNGREAIGWPRSLPGVPGPFEFALQGSAGGPALADVDPSPGLEIVAATYSGPSLLFDARGNVLRVLQPGIGAMSDLGPGGATLVNMSASAAWGDLTDDGVPEVFQAGTEAEWVYGHGGTAVYGLRSTPRYDHALRGWDPITGLSLPHFPRRVEDYGLFFADPAIADVGGGPSREVLHGDGGYLLHAFGLDGTEPAGWPKYTNGWIRSGPAVRDLDGDGLVEVVVTTLEGYLFAWRTPGAQARNDQWHTSGHDEHGTRVYGSQAGRVG